MNSRVTYTSRKGYLYHLGQGITKTGKERYFFSRCSPAAPVHRIPDGYEIVESINGVVSLRKSGRQVITAEELLIVKSEINQHPRLKGHRADAHGKAIVIYEPLGFLSESFLRSVSNGPAKSEDFCACMDPSQVQYSAVMRFILLDAASREFEAQRMCYRGGMEGWIPVDGGLLRALTRKYVAYVGTDAFFNLCRYR